MRHAYGNAHIHSDGDCDIYCNCDRTAAAYTDATASADTAGASRDQLL